MKFLISALLLFVSIAALAQHEGHTMPPTTPAVKKPAAKPVVKKKAARQLVKKQAATKMGSKKRPVQQKTVIKTAPAQAPGQHQGHGTASPKPTESKVPVKKLAPQPQEHQGHGAPTNKPAQSPPVQPGHEGHEGTVPGPTKPPTQVTPPGQQQHQGHGDPPPAGQTPKAIEFKLPPPEPLPPVNKQGWPKPVIDNETFSFTLFERLEYLPSGGGGAFAWDVTSWRGGDYRRVWFKTEGEHGFQSGGEGEGDLEIHYGRLIRPFYDFLTGLRFEGQWGGGTRGRVSIGAGLQGLAPYMFETEAFVFLSQSGQLYFNGTFTRDWYQTQRLILQPRVEVNAALNSDRRFGSGAGLNDLDLSLRLRYEIRREFAPYIGVSVRWLFGETAGLARGKGEDTSRLRFIAGLRMWF